MQIVMHIAHDAEQAVEDALCHVQSSSIRFIFSKYHKQRLRELLHFKKKNAIFRFGLTELASHTTRRTAEFIQTITLPQ